MADDDRRPNILLLFTDQQRFDTIAAAGAGHMRTPNLDRLVREGCTYTNAWSPNPVCMPARHYLITGQPASRHGYFTNCAKPIADPGLATIPAVLSASGYVTAAIGKMHFHPVRAHHGFDEMHLMEELPRFSEEDAYLRWLRDEGLAEVRNVHGVRPHIYHAPQSAQQDDTHHGNNWVAERSSRFIRENRSRPFFLMCGWIHPHPPWNIPPRWQGHYDGRDLPEAHPRARSFPYHDAPSHWFGDHDAPAARRAERAAYYTCVSMVDAAVGRVLDTLEEDGLLDDTLIIFTSDHGEMLQDRGLYQKECPYDGAARIPFIMRYPRRLDPGSSNAACCDLMDIFPTVLDAAGVDLSTVAGYGGQRLVGGSLLDPDDTSRERDRQYVEWGAGGDRWFMATDGRLKYIWRANGGTEECYDLLADPGEQHDRAADPAERARFQALADWAHAQEEHRAPPENRDEAGRPRIFPAEAWKETHCFGSKFPFWANMQFQTFGDNRPAWERDRFLAEIEHAVRQHGPDFLSERFDDPEHQRTFRQFFGYLAREEDPVVPWWDERG